MSEQEARTSNPTIDPISYKAGIEAAALLDAMRHECWTLRCVDTQTGGDDAEVGWEVVSHHQGKPNERVIAFGRTPEEALREAAPDVAGSLYRTEPQTAPASIVTCCVTGAIPGDGGACGDCDPCIMGEASVPDAVKRLIAEKNSLIARIGELEGTLAEVAGGDNIAPAPADAERLALADKILDAAHGAVAANPEKASQWHDRPAVIGWFVGQVMRAMNGEADQEQVHIAVLSSLRAGGWRGATCKELLQVPGSSAPHTDKEG